ncbi:regulator of chromosome condensation-like [Schistocerca gregaria]|uniref:regulator of chromosome condensation-like n=1 Tax=Schistocerca gregaria TaxID=7010 RepID=UPI00211E1CF4|nr:regulator of chromosome condensation-like [Schistocerca gregaria]
MSSRKRKPPVDIDSERTNKSSTKKPKPNEHSSRTSSKTKKDALAPPQFPLRSELDIRNASVLACGSGDMYQLGLGPDVMEAKRPRPIPELSNTHIRQLVAGGASNAAILVDPDSGKESVWTWGCNDLYALGRRTNGEDDQITPKSITGLTDVVQVSVGDNHMLALKSNGQVYYWGCYRDMNGILGFKFESKATKQLNPELLDISLKKKIVQIASGENSSFALTDGGKVYVWGDARICLRTSPRTNTRYCGLKPSIILCNQKFKKIFAGGFHVLLIAADGALWALGLNNYSQLGVDESLELTTRPRRVLGLPPNIEIKMAAAGQHHTLLLTQDGQVYSWGRGDYGQLGHGDTDPQPYPKKVEAFERLLKGDKVVQISTGGHHCLATTQNGEVYAWGFGDMAQLGVGVDEDKLVPEKLDNTNPKSHLTGKKVVWASGGGQHSVFLATPVPEAASLRRKKMK